MITKLTSYAAEAEILGQVRQVAWNGGVDGGGSVTIEGVDLAEAGRIFERLSDGTIQSVRLPAGPKKACGGCPPAPAEPAREASTPPDPEPGQVLPVPADAPPPPPPPPPVPEPTASTPDSGVPAVVRDATRLRDVVVYFQDKEGCDTVDKLVARCREYQAVSPLLSRTGDLEGRLRRVVENLAAAGPA